LNPLKKILSPFASLKLTVCLLAVSMVLVLAGTTAQRDMGIQDVLHNFFRCWWAKIDFHYFQPTPAKGHGLWPGHFWLPGGFTLIGLLLINLLSAHTVRFKFNRKRIGIILIHLGLVMLLGGEIITAAFAVESQMRVDVHGASNFSEDIRGGHAELAFTDPSAGKTDREVVIPQSILERAAATGELIHDPRLPVDVRVRKWYLNAQKRGPMETDGKIDRLATAGSMRNLGLSALPKSSGTEAGDDEPAAFVTLSKAGKELGTWLLTTTTDTRFSTGPMEPYDGTQKAVVDGKPWRIALRFERMYKPYTVYLDKFTHEHILGTTEEKNFASDIRLVDPGRHVNRTVRIWMNHPFRYNGETFYQASWDQAADRYTVLQVVKNPGWTVPYIACAVGALGLIIHFGTTLIGFLRRRYAAAEGTVGALEAAARRPVTNGTRGGKTSGRLPPASRPERYTLPSEHAWTRYALPMVVVGFAIIAIIAQLIKANSPTQAGPYNWDAAARLPIFYEGHPQPLDTLARNSLRILSGREVALDAKDKTHPPVQWLFDAMTRSGDWMDYKCIRIDHPQVKDLLGLPEKEKRFSLNDLFGGDKNGNLAKMEEQTKLAQEKSSDSLELYDHQILDLASHLRIFDHLALVDLVLRRYDYETGTQHMGELVSALSASTPGLVQKMQASADDPAQVMRILQQALTDVDFSKLSHEQQETVLEWVEQQRIAATLHKIPPEADLFLAAPLSPSETWRPLTQAIARDNPPESALAFLKIAQDYRAGRADDFNSDVAAYEARLDNHVPKLMGKIDYEGFFNRFDPFMLCMVFYVLVFILAFVSMLVWDKPLRRSAFWLLILALAIHTFGLVSRIYLSGRPPVTNLYSSAVFIAWGIVVFSAVLEAIYRNGIGLIAASAAGFTSLLVAAGLAVSDGDTMKQLQAVLDTNFWLATHVVCVTLGYTATFLAGLLAIIGLLRGILSSSLTPAESKDQTRMVYGILCFALLFSFVGTILGGIWADQSWGRFWGWDPKENGAVLVVLWNAMILHARWGGMVRDRGVMVLAVLGNIVTSWSWFGTNMLGIGLHSYGFMNSAQFWLTAFMFSQLAIAAIGLIPMRHWASRTETSG